LLRHLLGKEIAEKFCLPLSKEGLSRGSVTGKHMSSLHPEVRTDPKGIGMGGRIAAADRLQLHFLIAAGCFDSSALTRLKKFSKHDVDHMAGRCKLKPVLKTPAFTSSALGTKIS